ncbi:hypothetical protein WKI71_14270 [Streptomyces sp. MS1.AVA.1]|uniref:Uncharacterized protein n=1 Tax=Streptomyces machairae TaxID=3134109 RepID=A0ABU8UJW4_9ACTN
MPGYMQEHHARAVHFLGVSLDDVVLDVSGLGGEDGEVVTGQRELTAQLAAGGRGGLGVFQPG